MFKNNFRALLVQGVLSFICMGIGFIIGKFQVLQELLYQNFMGKLIISVLIILLYKWLSSILTTKSKARGDFFVGSYIFFLGLAFLALALVGMGKSVFDVAPGESAWRLGMDFISLPIQLVIYLLRSKVGIVAYIISIIFPSLLMGFFLRWKRVNRRQKRKK